LPTGWGEIQARNPRFVVFGEVHGTQESPALVASAACALSHEGRRVLVAVELGAESNPRLQQVWKTPREGFAARLVADLPFFKERQDGVASSAMLQMLDGLHAMSVAGKPLDVVAFNGFRDEAQARRLAKLPAQDPHEAAQAENIVSAADSRPYDNVLVLVGNLHARKLPVDHSGVSFDPMVMHLMQSGGVVSLVQTYTSGTAWNCIVRPGADLKRGEPISAAKVDCGAHEVGTSDRQPRSQVGLWSKDERGDPAYDGYYWFPVVHASPPAGAGASR
jgi:hypothetical protein